MTVSLALMSLSKSIGVSSMRDLKERVCQSLARCCQVWIDVSGGTFEH